MVRAYAAGQFYEAKANLLSKQIEECFHSDKGPGDLPLKRKAKRLFGVISPHAGYQFSGPCQAWAYKEIAESKFPSTYVILGPDHNGMHSTYTTTMDAWETPFGVVQPDKSFIIELLDKCKLVTKGNIMEHSIEVQLPFLQHVSSDRLRDLKIVPIVVPTSQGCEKLADAITEISEDIVVIVSSDFTHYGPQFLYTPFTYEVKKNLYELDGEAIKLLKKMDISGFLHYVNKTRATICGYNAIAAGLEIMKSMFAKKGELLSYYTSGDVIGDYTNAVGYSAMKFF